MGQTGHGQIGSKLKRDMCNSKDKTDYKVSNIKNDLIEYFPRKSVKKRSWKTQTYW